MSAPLIVIESFDPLRLTLPMQRTLAAEVRVRLPPVHVKLIDLSMGGLVPDKPHIGLDAPMSEITINFSEPVSVGQVVDSIAASASSWQALWEASQAALDKCGPLLG